MGLFTSALPPVLCFYVFYSTTANNFNLYIFISIYVSTKNAQRPKISAFILCFIVQLAKATKR